jgi:hypothetical protein
MDRRSFIKKAGVGVAGGLAAGLAHSQTKTPCTLPSITLDTGSPVTTSCNIGAAADWQQRISGPGVVWYHNFDTAAEVNAFRWDYGYGNDPLDKSSPGIMVWDSTDGFAGGGCMRMNRAAGTTEGSEWWRPFAPLTSPGNGRSTNDPAANGTLPVRSFLATDRGSQTNNFPQKGFYGNAAYHTGDTFDGTEYYFQVRVKMDPNRAAAGNPEGGKLFYFTRTDLSLTTQELVTESGVPIGGKNYFQMYRAGSPPLYTDPPGSGVTGHQPGNTTGTVGDKLCRLDDLNGRLVNCWAWPTTQQWTTLLYHVRPGLNSNGDTLVEVWVCEQGQTTYKQIWSQPTVNLGYSLVNGHNALICSGYMNNQNFATGFFHKWTQLIFSKQFIPPPSA